ncbi:hypothetical protein IWX90DRAFT_390902 [Phyllosticta citrichinensis]|uniref:Uncharacterized protein n=1 Tax=Phyllosticta citrichinensis TaxID=1130410 RepID=A0ABR1XJ94_9PEZI
MATTPPLLERISTPPAPARGPQFDDWEPYRRSRRVAAQRDRHLQNHSASPPQRPTASSARARASTPLGRRSSPHSSTAQTISPPSSPHSPIKRTTLGAFKPRDIRRSFDSDSDPFTTSSRGESSSLTAGPILPTPAKTPAKRKVSQAAFGSTARVLFHDRPATIDEVMPPKTSRKKQRAGFSLAGYSESFECDKSSKIEIYTDGKERVPSYNQEEDNPFVTKPGEARPKPGPSSAKPKSERDEKMERRARNGEGVIHVFRGKKFFSEFTDHDSEVDETESPLGGSPIRRIAASSTAPRRILRSSIKPRLLWPTEEQQAAREHGSSKSSEEDPTDIDTDSGKHYQVSRGHRSAFHEEATSAVPQQDIPTSQTPAKQRCMDFATPPPTRSTRASTKKDAVADEGPSPQQSPSRTSRQDVQSLDVALPVPKKRSPFDAWRRTKSGSGSTTAKREGELLEPAGAKRTRSATHAQASSSTQ